jgi:ABC-2 type transport system ATP-binding protein
VLLCDEPVNGLDPEGILWIRTFFRERAAEGRTVFVSSHLMSEMALTADHLIVVGRGRLIADASVSEIIERHSASSVLVRSPVVRQLAALLDQRGADVSLNLADDSIIVTGLSASAVGDLAVAHGLAVHELVSRQASLEEAFMELTRNSVDFRPEAAA